MIRTIVLELDEPDYNIIQSEIVERQRLSKYIDPLGPTLIPDGDSNLAGALLSECIRDLQEYRQLMSLNDAT